MEFERFADKKRLAFISSNIRTSIGPKAAVLDVGCGNGFISYAVASLGFQVDAIDVSEKTISQARSLNPHPNINYQVVGAGELQPKNQFYSAIICSEVLEHLHKPEELLNILRQSLRNDGILIVTVPNGIGPREMLVTRPVQYISRKNNFISRGLQKVKSRLGYTGTTVQSSAEDLSHIQFFTTGELKQLAAASGFRIEKWAASNFVEQVFPVSLLTKRVSVLQRLDCKMADLLPLAFTSGFMMMWRKI